MYPRSTEPSIKKHRNSSQPPDFFMSGDTTTSKHRRDEYAANEDDDLFEKIQLCSTVYDFGDDKIDIQSKYQKRKALHKLVVELAAERELTDEAYTQLIRMISVNLFRISPSKDQNIDPDNELTLVEPSWEHLKWVYELLLVLLTSPHFNLSNARYNIDCHFILQMLNLLESGDARKRRYLLRIVYQVYKNFVSYRPVIRQETVNIFLKFIYETGAFNGISEMVELLGIIIHGLSVPLKGKHKALVRILLPLHRMECLALYHRHLTYCVLEMIRKNSTLVEYITKGLLNHWPRTNAKNQVMFIKELREILSLVTLKQFVKIQVPLFEQLAKSSASLHHNVAECALDVWEDPNVVKLVQRSTQVVMPIMFPAMCHIIEEHWNKKVVNDALKVLKKFKAMDFALMQGLIRVYTFEQRREEKRKRMEEEMLRRFASLDRVLINLSNPF